MKIRDFIICFTMLIIAAALFLAAGSQLDYINAKRQQMNLTAKEPLENAPPSLAFATIAMGTFRGLIVDILWLRAEALKQEGQFFDAKQLADWITILQPRLAAVWEFHAWNMAYNISVAIPANQPEQRWKWVKNGYELLRDKGIQTNPESIRLYRELSRIFLHKIGGITDDAHKYYKLQLAMAMQPLLANADNKFFEKLANAPKTWDEILTQKQIKQFVKDLAATDPAFANRDRFVENYISLRQNPARFESEAFDVIDDYRRTDALKKFDLFAKAFQLRSHWKLEPRLMKRLNETYGPINITDPNQRFPLDWRHPDTHAIYWAVRGLEIAGGRDFSIDETNTDRMVAHSLQDLFRSGKIYIYSPLRKTSEENSKPEKTNFEDKQIFLRPDLRMFDSYNKAMTAQLEKYKKFSKQSIYRTFQIAHRNMFINAAFSFYQAGHIHQARKIYNQLRKLYPGDEFKIPFVVFIKNRFRGEIQSLGIDDAREMIQLMLRESYFRYAMRDDDIAAARENMAEEIYNTYKSIYHEKRIELPTFELLRYLALGDFFSDPTYPTTLREKLIARIKLEKPDLAEKLKQIERNMIKQKQNQTPK